MTTTVLDYLSVLLKCELQSSNTYFMHNKILQQQGWDNLAKQEHDNYLDEVGHAGKFIDRIFFLDGEPEYEVGKISWGSDIVSILEIDMKLEQEGISHLKRAISQAISENDYGTVTLLQGMLLDEEGHLDQIQSQYSSLKYLGVERYLQKYG